MATVPEGRLHRCPGRVGDQLGDNRSVQLGDDRFVRPRTATDFIGPEYQVPTRAREVHQALAMLHTEEIATASAGHSQGT
jgi:hypothetical protein